MLGKKEPIQLDLQSTSLNSFYDYYYCIIKNIVNQSTN